jgi:hypothetical protein
VSRNRADPPDEWDRYTARRTRPDDDWDADTWPDTNPDRRPDRRPDTASAIPDRLDARRQVADANRGRTPDRDDDAVPARTVRLTPASDIPLKTARWLWDTRIPLGEITLMPGREGIGKSLALAWLTARVTRGQLPGIYRGQPRAVIYAATEDSWSHTIGPRLHAAGADLDKVFRADVLADASITSLTLPSDIGELFTEAERHGVVLLACDPILSLISAAIDDFRDRSLRTALEPLHAAAERAGCAVVGLAHFNKSGGTDPLNLITGSRAWSAVCRAVLAMARDTAADDGSCVITLDKCNLGPIAPEVPSLRYVIEPAEVPTPEGPASVGVLVFKGETDRHVRDILAETTADPAERAERDEAADWLTGYLADQGGEAASKDVLKAAKTEGFSTRTLHRARERAGVTCDREGFPARTIWRLKISNGRAPSPATAVVPQPAQSCHPSGTWHDCNDYGTTTQHDNPL